MKYLILIFSSLLCYSSIAQTYELDDTYTTGTGFNAEVNTSDFDGNGKLLIGGNFTSYNGTTRNYLARLNTDGTVDTGFDPGTSLSSSVTHLTIHVDNSVTVISAGVLKRFSSAGALIGSGTFDPASANNVIETVEAESTGFGVIIGGFFTDIGNRIARLNADGTVDGTFATNLGTGFNGTVRTIKMASNGQILVGGEFTSFNSTTRNSVAVLNSTGTLDTSFDPGVILVGSTVYDVAIQEDGKVLAGLYSGVKTSVVRLNGDKTSDNTFQANVYAFNSKITTIKIIGTTDIIVGGWFPKGVINFDFNGAAKVTAAGNGIEGGTVEVNTIAVQSDESLILSGDFTTYNSTSANNIVRTAYCGLTIDSQPESKVICPTEETTFSVVAAGTGTLSYQWQEDPANETFADLSEGNGYTGTTTSILTIAGGTTGGGYQYKCIITDDDCNIVSSVASLNLQVQTITQDPENFNTCDGSGALFSISYTGLSGGFQWQEDPGTGTFSDLAEGGNYSGTNSSSLTIVSAGADMEGFKYRLKSTRCNAAGVFTTAGTLSIASVPILESSTGTQVLCESGDISYSVIASNNSEITYQWGYYIGSGNYVSLADGTNYSGTQTATLNVLGADNTLPELFDADNSDGLTWSNYRCTITANGCSINSPNSSLNIRDIPTIDTDPISVAVCEGAETTFAVVSSTGYNYQWQVDDGNGYINIVDDETYSNSLHATMTISNALTNQNGYKYRCNVGACSTPVISGEAILTVDQQVVIEQQPETQIICAGTDIEFSVTATGTNLTYQWQVYNSGFEDLLDDATYFGTDSPTLQITSTPNALDDKRYICVISSGVCQISSSYAFIRINNPPTISYQPQNKTACDAFSGTSFFSGWQYVLSAPYSYQWQEAFAGSDIFIDLIEGSNYTGTTDKTLVLPNPTFSMSGNKYRLKINGCVTDILSNEATLTVLAAPIFTAFPESPTVCPNENITLTATATGTDIKYEWHLDNGDGNGYQLVRAAITNPDYIIYNVSSDYDGYKYKCVAVLSYPCTDLTAESFEATITVSGATIESYTDYQTICHGENATFSVNVAGQSLVYQWYEGAESLSDDELYSGTHSNTLQITNATSDLNQKNYRCIVSGSGNCSEQTSPYARLNVNGGHPVITGNFSDPDYKYIYTNYIVSGYDTFTWYLDGTLIQDFCNCPDLTIDQAGSYTVIRQSENCQNESDPFVVESTDLTNGDPNTDPDVVTTIGLESSTNSAVFPNPIFNKFSISLNSSNASKITLLSLDGSIAKYFGIFNESNIELNRNDLKAGVYLLQIDNEMNRSIQKIIIK